MPVLRRARCFFCYYRLPSEGLPVVVCEPGDIAEDGEVSKVVVKVVAVVFEPRRLSVRVLCFYA